MYTKLKYNKYLLMFPKMANQIQKINSKRQVLQLKPPRIFLQTIMVGLFMLASSICSVQAATCPSSIPSSAATTTEQCTFDLHFGDLNSDFRLSSILRSFTGYSFTQTRGEAVGPVSNSLYYLYYIQPEKKRCDINFASCIFNVLKRIVGGK